MPLVLRWLGATTAPVDGSVLQPDRLVGVDLARLPIRVGNRMAVLGDLCVIEGDGADGSIVVEGDLRSVHGVGSGMTGGRISIRGDVGHRLGVAMTGGEIEVVGSVGRGAGADLSGGTIRIKGDAGDDLGAALPGSRIGMRGGLILVDGNAGPGVGTALRRGIIAISGSAGSGVGRGLIAGSIFVGGAVGPGLALGMKRGTVALTAAPADFDPGPTFEPSGSYRPPVATIFLKQLRDWGFPVADHAFAPPFRRYNGDRGVAGQGEIWLFGPAGAR